MSRIVGYSPPHLPRCYAGAAHVYTPAEKELKRKLAATNRYQYVGGAGFEVLVGDVLQNKPEYVKELYRQYARAGAITEAELQVAPTDYNEIDRPGDNERNGADHKMLTRGALLTLLAFNRPYQILIKLLLGLHSANVRTNKGSIYRARFVAPGKSHDVPDPAMKSAAKADTDPKAIPTSTAYPLLTAPAMGMYLGMSVEADVSVHDKLDAEFQELVEAELDALEDLTVTGSSSVTDTNWGDDYRRKSADSQMYTEQHMPKHMMFDYERSQKET